MTRTRDTAQARPRTRRQGAASLVLAAAAVLLLGAGCGWGFDPYDDETRGTNASTGGMIKFGQRIGPDGDGCWIHGGWFNNGKVYCDLVSIGGLHWDAGDIRVEHSSDIDIGSGFVCLRDTDGRPWCWEWDSDTPPRPARVPQDQTFVWVTIPHASYGEKIPDNRWFVCGQAPDYLQVTCWTVGAAKPSYRQATHRFIDGGEWAMRWVGLFESDKWPYFDAVGGLASGNETFHAFTGKQRHRQPGEPRLLVTETVP